MIRRQPSTTLFPYTTLFRSQREEREQLGRHEVVPPDLLAQRHVMWRLAELPARSHRRRRTAGRATPQVDRKSTRLNSSHVSISYAVFCLKKKNNVYGSF